MSAKPLLFSLVAIAAVFFLYVIIQAGLSSLGKPKKVNDWMLSIAVMISGVLATNLGAVLGFSVQNPPVANVVSYQSTTNEAAFRPATLGLHPSVLGNNPQQPTLAQNLQIIAAYFYIVSLLTAAVFYFIAKDKPTLVAFIFNLTNTLAGVIIGALTVALGK